MNKIVEDKIDALLEEAMYPLDRNLSSLLRDDYKKARRFASANAITSNRDALAQKKWDERNNYKKSIAEKEKILDKDYEARRANDEYRKNLSFLQKLNPINHLDKYRTLPPDGLFSVGSYNDISRKIKDDTYYKKQMGKEHRYSTYGSTPDMNNENVPRFSKLTGETTINVKELPRDAASRVRALRLGSEPSVKGSVKRGLKNVGLAANSAKEEVKNTFNNAIKNYKSK